MIVNDDDHIAILITQTTTALAALRKLTADLQVTLDDMQTIVSESQADLPQTESHERQAHDQ
jgi:hypothetical protein